RLDAESAGIRVAEEAGCERCTSLRASPPAHSGIPVLRYAETARVAHSERDHGDEVAAQGSLVKPVGRGDIALRYTPAAAVAEGQEPEGVQMFLSSGKVQP